MSAITTARAELKRAECALDAYKQQLKENDQKRAAARETEVLNVRSLKALVDRAVVALREAQGGGMVIRHTRGIFGRLVELRIEENGHSANDTGGCICRECRDLRAADGRCTDCGTTKMKHSVDGRCCGCNASGLGL